MNILIYLNNTASAKLDSVSQHTMGWGATEDYIYNIGIGLSELGHNVTIGGWVVEKNDKIRYVNTKTLFHEHPHFDVVIGIRHIEFLKELTGICTWDKSYLWISVTDLKNSWDDYNVTQLSTNEITNYKFNGIVCNTKYHESIIRKLIDDSIPTFIIPPGINLNEYPNTFLKQKNSFIWTSDLSRGLESFLKNWKYILKEYPDSTLKICYPSYVIDIEKTDPTLYDWFEGLTKNIPSITVLGNLSKKDLFKELDSTEYWVYTTSFEETYCTTVMEMMYSKVKIITSKYGSLPEVIGTYGVHRDFQIKVRSEDIISAIKEYNQSPKLEDAYKWATKNTYKHRIYEWNYLISK